MKRALLRAAAQPFLLLLITVIAFYLLRTLPGGPLDQERAAASPEIEAALRAEYQLDQPRWRQCVRYVRGIALGDFGPSLKYRNRTVGEILRAALPVSMNLGLLAFVTALGLGIPLGMAAAFSTNRWVVGLNAGLAFLGLCIPPMVLGPLLILVCGLWHAWLPVALWETWRHVILPTIALGLFFAARVARLMSAGMGGALRSPFLMAARAKGLSTRNLALKHAFPVAIQPVVSYAGPMLADLLTGSFAIESIFQIPGAGGFFVNSLFNRDYTLMLGLTIVYSALVMTLNTVGDLTSSWLDPRIRKT